ncbi:hypothetical protein Sjap_015892 [Stephania japonica]|uniref:ATPase AAA-type core domain-containing protein n=1 Tax=Stephania japonica TaxID=461633 RepID=A0AAP0IKG6_9MAGN
MSPYFQRAFHEYTGERLERSRRYTAIQSYLNSDTSKQAKRLQANMLLNSKSNVRNGSPKKRRYYKLTFHKKHRELVTDLYLNHVLEEGKKIRIRNRQRKLFTNNRIDGASRNNDKMWSHVSFDHPASFRTMTMDPEKKKEVVDDLKTFRESKDYYQEIGKAWKRGYLLYGPPGTGKSTMIAAMANLLEYDIYDLELTSVKDNTELKKLLIEVLSKSIIAIEDIDYLTGERKKKDEDDEEGEGKNLKIKNVRKDVKVDKESKLCSLGLGFADPNSIVLGFIGEIHKK